MYKAALIWSLLLIWIGQGVAQTPFTVRGIVEDTAGIALPNATVRLWTARDSITVLTKADGHFQGSFPSAATFVLLVTMKGFLSYRKQLTVPEKNEVLQLKPILLRTDYRELDPVTISRIRPLTIGVDTTTYNAAAFPVRDGAEVEALLKRMPGIEVDMDGNVIVQGKKVTRILVDGKLFFGGDVLTAIRNLPAEIVDKLQVIDDYGDKARLTGVRSGESVKVLNIVLKPDRRNGQFGQLQAAMGSQDKYTANVFVNSFKGERQASVSAGLENNNPAGKDLQKHAGLSYADKWSPFWRGDVNLSYSGDKPHSSGSLIQDNFFAGGQTHLEQATQNSGSNQNANLGSNFSYSPDAFHTLRISPSLGGQRGNQSTTADFSTVQRDSSFTKTSTGQTLNQSTTASNSVGMQGYYEQLSPHSKRRFSAQVNIRYSDNRQVNDNQLHTTVVADSLRSISLQHYLVNNSNLGWDLGANLNYFAPLGPTGFLELGYAWHDNLSRNNKITRQQDSLHPSPVLIDSLSQDYFYWLMDQRLHAGYTAHFQKLNITLGLDMQPGQMSGNTSVKAGQTTGNPSGEGGTVRYPYLNWLPTIQAAYAFSKSRTLSFQYSGSPSLPGLQQVQPVTDLTNPQYPVTGNPGLRPAYSQGLSLHYEQSSLKPTQFSGFGVSLGYNNTRNNIIADIIHPKDSSAVVQKTVFVNAGDVHSVQGDYHASLPAVLNKHLRITLGGSLSSSQAVSMTDDITYTTVSLSASQNMHLQFIIPNLIETDLSGNYNLTNTHYPAGNGAATSFAAAGWSASSRHYFGHHWILNYQWTQSFAGEAGWRLQSNPALLTAYLQRELLPKNKATITFTAFDLLNSATGVNQSFTPTSITKSQTTLTGRYFMLQFVFKFGKFGN